MRRYSNSVHDVFGNAVENARVTATNAEDGAAVQLYADRDGLVPIGGNVAYTDAQGMFFFYARNSRLNIKAEKNGVQVSVGDEIGYDPEDNALDLSKYVRRETEFLPDRSVPVTIYRGTAPVGSLVADPVWTIDRLTLSGLAVVSVARSTPLRAVAWVDRATATYL